MVSEENKSIKKMNTNESNKSNKSPTPVTSNSRIKNNLEKKKSEIDVKQSLEINEHTDHKRHSIINHLQQGQGISSSPYPSNREIFEIRDKSNKSYTKNKSKENNTPLTKQNLNKSKTFTNQVPTNNAYLSKMSTLRVYIIFNNNQLPQDQDEYVENRHYRKTSCNMETKVSGWRANKKTFKNSQK